MLSFAFSINREATTNYRMWKQGLFPSHFFFFSKALSDIKEACIINEHLRFLTWNSSAFRKIVNPLKLTKMLN